MFVPFLQSQVQAGSTAQLSETEVISLNVKEMSWVISFVW